MFQKKYKPIGPDDRQEWEPITDADEDEMADGAHQKIEELRRLEYEARKRIARLENMMDGIREAAQTARDDEELRRYIVQALSAD